MIVNIPPKDKAPYTLWARGSLKGRSIWTESRGVFLDFSSGTVLLRYTLYPGGKRIFRAVRPAEEAGEASYVAGVKEPVKVLGAWRGRKVDLAERLEYILRKNYTDKVYEMSAEFWTRLLSLIDLNFNGKEASVSKENIVSITDEFIKREKIKYICLKSTTTY